MISFPFRGVYSPSGCVSIPFRIYEMPSGGCLSIRSEHISGGFVFHFRFEEIRRDFRRLWFDSVFSSRCSFPVVCVSNSFRRRYVSFRLSGSCFSIPFPNNPTISAVLRFHFPKFVFRWFCFDSVSESIRWLCFGSEPMSSGCRFSIPFLNTFPVVVFQFRFGIWLRWLCFRFRVRIFFRWLCLGPISEPLSSGCCFSMPFSNGCISMPFRNMVTVVVLRILSRIIFSGCLSILKFPAVVRYFRF